MKKKQLALDFPALISLIVKYPKQTLNSTFHKNFGHKKRSRVPVNLQPLLNTDLLLSLLLNEMKIKKLALDFKILNKS